METVNNLINAATNIVYGESNKNNPTGTQQSHENPVGNQTNAVAASPNNTTGGQEPLSGYTGAGTATNPYDAGNTTGEHSNSTSNIGSKIPSSSSGSSMPINSGFAATENTISTTKISNPSAAAVTSSRDTGLAPSESVRAPTIKHQELVAPNVTQSHATSERTNAAETVSSSKGKNPSLTITSTPAGTGSIGGDTMNPSHHETHTPKPHSTTSHNQEDKLGSVSAEKGTGEIYIKSSGTIADGGDFDAARAGAGREADRLLELKGIVRESGNVAPPHDEHGNKVAASTGHASEEKHGLGQKLKDKLHLKK